MAVGLFDTKVAQAAFHCSRGRRVKESLTCLENKTSTRTNGAIVRAMTKKDGQKEFSTTQIGWISKRRVQGYEKPNCISAGLQMTLCPDEIVGQGGDMHSQIISQIPGVSPLFSRCITRSRLEYFILTNQELA